MAVNTHISKSEISTKRIKKTVEKDIFLVDMKEVAKAESSPRVGFAKSLRDLLK